ncbi:MAG: ABC transporter ATP-binding protein [Fervidicoccaceae archaeon]
MEELRKVYRTGSSFAKTMEIRAIDGIDLDIAKGEVLGLLGESGSGKTTLGKILAGIEKPSAGKVLLFGEDAEKFLKKSRKKVQMIFQNPDTSLNPRMSVGETLKEALQAGGREGSTQEIKELLEMVGLEVKYMGYYPSQLSGGQKQRVAIARALSVKPDLIIGDEIVSALDATVKVQILSLMQELQREFGFTLLFISHDLPITRAVSNRIAVMYLGKIVEILSPEELMDNPMHPYTRHLLSSLPSIYLKGISLDGKRLRLKEIQGHPPTKGCKLQRVCPFATKRCSEEEPPMVKNGKDHFVFCHLYSKN